MNKLSKPSLVELNKILCDFLLFKGSFSEFIHLHCSWYLVHVWRPLNVSPYCIIVQMVFSGSLGLMSSFWFVSNDTLLHKVLLGGMSIVSSMFTTKEQSNQ